MKQRKLFIRAFTLILAVSVLPLLLTGNNTKKDEGSPYPGVRIVTCNVLSLPVTSQTEEFLTTSQLRISNAHSAKPYEGQRQFTACLSGSSPLLLIPLLILTSVFLLPSGANYSHRSIIKYIHDKDGRKSLSPYIE